MAFTDSASLGDLHRVAFSKNMEMALRSEPTYRLGVGSARKVVVGREPGDTVAFAVDSDFGVATTAVSETSDPAPQAAASTTTINVLMSTYAAWNQLTELARFNDYTGSIDQRYVDKLRNQAINTVDALIEAKLQGAPASNVIVPTTAGGTQYATATGTTEALNANTIRGIVSQFEKKSVAKINGEYIAFVNPSVVSDLRSNTDAAGWRAPHTAVDTGELYRWELGSFEGVRFVQTPRTLEVAGLFNSYFMGQDALAEAVGYDITAVLDGVIHNPLDRFTAYGWKFFGGWSLFRPEALYVVKSRATKGVIA